MGTPGALTLTNLFMGKVEADLLTSWPGTQPLIWLRHIDNILVILESSPAEMNSLVSHCNSRMSTIQYTSEVSMLSVDFLDITIFKGYRYREEGKLDIRPYSKVIDPHSYLHYSSAHHISIKRGMIKADFIHTLRRSSSPNIYGAAAMELTQWFVSRGYPKDLIKETICDIKYTDRQGYLEHREKKTLEECTTLLRVRQHPAITSTAIYKALEEKDLPFKAKVLRPKPTSIGELITRAASDSIRSDYSLRSNNTSSNQGQNRSARKQPQPSTSSSVPLSETRADQPHPS